MERVRFRIRQEISLALSDNFGKLATTLFLVMPIVSAMRMVGALLLVLTMDEMRKEDSCKI